MDQFKLEPGQSIHLTTNSIFYKNVYESTLLKVKADVIEISTPYFKGLHVPLNIGFILVLKVSTDQGIYEFTTEVIDRNIPNHSLLVKLPKPDHKSNAFEGCKFVTITSGKGGVGKTSFIINYAIALAQKGKRVVLLDADLGMANVDVLLKVNARYNLIHVIDGSKNLEDIITDAPGGIKIIPGGSGIQDLANLTTPQFYRITSGFDYLEQNFDYVLIDTGAGLSKNITNFIFSSDETIILTTPEPHAITDAYSIIKVIMDKNRDLNLKLIINKCETLQEGESVMNRISGVVRNFLNCSIIPCGCILDSKVVTKSIKEQVPLYLTYPTSDVAKSIGSIADMELGNIRSSRQSGSVTGFVTKFKNLFGKA